MNMTRTHRPVLFHSTSFFIILILACLLSPTVQAGDVTGKVRGFVKDGQGNPVIGATIIISDLTMSERQYTTKTNKKGNFSYMGLDPVVHSVEANFEGFRPATKQVKVRIGLWVEANMTLFKGGESGFAREGAKTDGEKAIEEFNRGLMLVEENKFDEALAALDKAIELDDMIYEPVQTKAQLYFDKGEHDKALEYFNKALEMGSTEPTNFYFLSEIYKAKGNTAKAKEFSDKYLSESENLDIDVLFNMAVQSLNQNNDEEAKGFLLQIIEMEPEYADAYRELGYIFIREGSFPSAKEHFQKYIDMVPDAADTGEVKSMMEIL